MELKTRFSNGEKIYIAQMQKTGKRVPFLGTVGMVRVEVVESPGRFGETLFDNYKPQSGYKEEYMLVETGIRSGSIFTLGENIFANLEECEEAIARLEASNEHS